MNVSIQERSATAVWNSSTPNYEKHRGLAKGRGAQPTALSLKNAWKLQKRCYFIANASVVGMAFISPFLTMSDGIYGRWKCSVLDIYVFDI